MACQIVMPQHLLLSCMGQADAAFTDSQTGRQHTQMFKLAPVVQQQMQVQNSG